MAIQFAVSSSSIKQGQERSTCRRGATGRRRTRSQGCAYRPSHAGQSRCASHDWAETNKQVVKLLPLVRRVALQFRGHLPSHVELDDLVSDGTVGLIEAVRKYDPAKGVSIESYARYRIRGAILDSLREQDHASRDMRRRIKQVESTWQKLELRLGRPAGDVEMARELGLSLEQWYRRAAELRRLGFEGSVARIPPESARRVNEEDLPASPEGSPFELCYQSEQRDLLSQALRCLTERERRIITLYYKESMTMKQIGRLLKIDESRVSQLRSGAMTRLHRRVADMIRRPSVSAGSTCLHGDDRIQSESTDALCAAGQ